MKIKIRNPIASRKCENVLIWARGAQVKKTYRFKCNFQSKLGDCGSTKIILDQIRDFLFTGQSIALQCQQKKCCINSFPIFVICHILIIKCQLNVKLIYIPQNLLFEVMSSRFTDATTQLVLEFVKSYSELL